MERPPRDHDSSSTAGGGDSASGGAGGEGEPHLPGNPTGAAPVDGDGLKGPASTLPGDGSPPPEDAPRSLPVLHADAGRGSTSGPSDRPLLVDPPASLDRRWAWYDRLDMLRRGRWWIITGTVLTLGVMVLVTALTPREYDAYSLLLINTRQPLLDAASEYAPLPGVEERRLLNQALILQHSPEIAQRTARRLLAKDASLLVLQQLEGEVTVARLAQYLQRSVVRVEPEGSDLDAVRISATAPSPSEAALVAALYTDEYLARTRETSRMALTSARAFLEHHLEQRRTELARIEERIEQFERSTGSINLPHQAAGQITQVAQLEVALDRARVEQQLRRAALWSFEHELAELQPRIQEFVAAGSDHELRQINAQIGSLEATAQNVRRRNPDLEPGQPTGTRLDEIDRQLTQLRRQRNELTERYVEQVVAAGGVDLSNQQRGATYLTELRRRMAEERVALAGAEAEIAALEQRLGEIKGALTDLPGRAMQLAQLRRQQAAAESMLLYLGERAEQARVAEQTEFGLAQVIRPATEPTGPVRPRTRLNLAVGLLLGLLLGVAGATFRHSIDGTVHAPKDLQGQGLPVLGVVPRLDERGLPVADDAPLAPPDEIFRQVLTNLRLSGGGPRPQSLVVAGAEGGAGATTLAVQLATTAARSGLRTLLVEGDLRQPTLREHVQVGQRLPTGRQRAPLGYWTTDVEQLIVLAPLSAAHRPDGLWTRERVRELLVRVRPVFDLIIFDAPPVLLAADASVIASQTDAVVLVARAGLTHQDALAHVAGELYTAGGELLGTVLNDFDAQAAYGYRNTFGYRHKQLQQAYA